MSLKNIQTNNTSHNAYLLLLTTLSVGILTGCQYCEPLLFASLIAGAVFKLLTAQPAPWNKPLKNFSL